MTPEALTIVANVVLTPILTLFTLWVKSALKSGQARERRNEDHEDAYIEQFEKRIADLEKEVRELRVELKNRDGEYIELYKKYTTLNAQHEVLQADYDQTVKELHDTQAELTKLKEDIRNKALATAEGMKP